jgi:NAD(P)-dependent dehydrogenase (short-subunit alcohol dehydrogenase family)
MRLKDRVAIVTGGGVGIGRAIALAFAREGAAVVTTSRTLSNLEKVTNEIKGKGGRATAIPADISDEKQVQKMVAQTLDEYGQIDILVNNSGVAGATANVVDVTLDDWNKTLAVNLTGTMLCSREVLKSMIPRQSGNIINIASMAARAGFIMRSPYCVSKWGVVGLTLTLAAEVGIYNIRVNAISPGFTQGPRIEAVLRAKAEAMGIPYQDFYDSKVANIALRRFATPDEIAAAAVFLASDESSSITGEVLNINSGCLLNIW